MGIINQLTTGGCHLVGPWPWKDRDLGMHKKDQKGTKTAPNGTFVMWNMNEHDDGNDEF